MAMVSMGGASMFKAGDYVKPKKEYNAGDVVLLVVSSEMGESEYLTFEGYTGYFLADRYERIDKNENC